MDQGLSSGTNFLAAVVVARHASPQEFGVFSVFLIIYYLLVGFNRSVPHAIAMTLDWDDERARSGYFFLPAFALGIAGTLVLLPVLTSLDRGFVWLPAFFVPLLLQDAVRMHCFAVGKPERAIVSDAVWLGVLILGISFVSTANEAALLWAFGSICGAAVIRPWTRLRWVRRPVRASVVSSALEYLVLVGFGYLAPLLAASILSVQGVGALQGAGMIRGPIGMLVQGLVAHKMAGAPILRLACIREALRLSVTILAATSILAVPLILLKDAYGPRILGSTWPLVQPLLIPTVVALLLGSVAFGPATVARKMSLFRLSARVQITLAPLFIILPILGAAHAGPQGFLYGTSIAYAISAAVWWTVLSSVRRQAIS